MRILVTGATGSVGSHLVSRLFKRKDTIRLFVRQPEKVEKFREQGAEVIVGDLGQPETLVPAVADVDAIIHLAAFFRGATPEEAKAVNQDGTLTLAQEALRAKVTRFVFVSTGLVYGPGLDHPANESDLPNPITPYPISKFEAEQALMELYQTHNLGLRILRLSFVYGEGDPHLADGMRWFRNWHPQRQFQLVHHADVAQAIMLATYTSGIDGEIYNVANEEPTTMDEIIKANGEQVAEDAFNYPLNPPNDPINVSMSTVKIRRELGFKSQYPTLQDAIDRNVL